jgi:excinuclease UvrABC nuclease subunit
VPLFRRTPAQVPEPERRPPTMLEVYGARLLPDLSGWWVYALCDKADGHVFYVGISDHLLSRLRDHSYHYADKFDHARVYLIAADNEATACVRQLALIDYHQPEHNTLGTTEALRRRVMSFDRPGSLRAPRSLDPSKASA